MLLNRPFQWKENRFLLYQSQQEKQKEFGYVNMATLYYNFQSTEYEYLNFTVKLVLGIKSDGRHVQYSVNKIELAEKSTL